jgi:glycosyltransferase involved in cell wall biosynthesis
MNELISIITPSYNQGLYIERSLQSVLLQGIENLEYIVMDGASDDTTLSILEKYTAKINWYSEQDNGQTHALNKGIRVSKGSILGWLNSDDIYYPNTFEKVLTCFSRNPKIDVIYGNANHINEYDDIIEPYPVEPWSTQRLYETCFICQPAVFFRRRVVEQFGLFDETLKYCMDYEYWLRLAKQGVAFYYLPQLLAGSRLYPAAKTLRDRLKVHREINDMFYKKCGSVPDHWLYNYAHVFADVRGLNRQSGFLFLLVIAVTTLLAAFRWNYFPSRGLLRTVRTWLRFK